LFDTIFRPGLAFCGLVLVQLAIKLLDDYLDQQEDGEHRCSLADVMGQGTVAYVLLFYAISSRLDPNWAFTIFISSYACGMLGTSDWLLPSGLPPRVEIIIVLLLGLMLAGWSEMLSSWVLVLGVHLIDDVLDEKQQGQHTATKNLAHRFGRVEVCLAGIVCSLMALFLNPVKAILSWIALPLVLYIAANPGLGRVR
jgi:hypothetical protein